MQNPVHTKTPRPENRAGCQTKKGIRRRIRLMSGELLFPSCCIYYTARRMIMQILRVFDNSTVLPDSLPSLAEADKRNRKAEWLGELAFAFIDTLPALPDSVPDSSDFSPDSEDEVRAGIERKRIW